ncbi:MAG: aldo/keto reductase [Chitinispirillia bacterium]|nr:aldo/keto reductase [Chitinispirillia bacterium]MCL2269341.1 aldo/keto reductase [Chitinispirillia bacterium]
MQYRSDKFGNRLSALGFGCMRFPRIKGKIDMAASEAMVVDAVSRGVNYFDTAYIYPGSEEAFGQIVQNTGLRGKISIATKLPIFMCKSYADFDKFFNTSLKRLKTEYVDYYLMHMITTPEQWRSLCDLGIERWIDEKKAAGKIRQLGFSFHGKRDDYVKIVDARDWDFTMIQYNYLDINNQAGRTGLEHAASKGIPVMIMEPLLGGRLAREGDLPPKVREVFAEAGNQFTPAARALRWLWNHPQITTVLSGMGSRRDLDDNIAAAESVSAPNTLNEKELETIDKAISAFNESNRIKCTGCGYCVPCPFGVNIPDCFSAYNMSYVMGRMSSLQKYLQATAALTTSKGMAGSCKSCGKCEAHCPQSIRIAASLKLVKKRLEPFWFTAPLSIVRLFTGVKNKRG